MMRISDVPWLVLASLSRRDAANSIEVRMVSNIDNPAEVLERITAAIELIAKHDPRAHHQLSRRVKRLLVTEAGGAHFIAGIATCRIGVRSVVAQTTTWLAMTLIHEATHARLAQAGIPYNERYRARIEQLCVREEIAFAEKVPGSEAEVARARNLLSQPWWTPEQHKRNSLAELRRLGFPEWLLRWFS
jgi:hypothetical protein